MNFEKARKYVKENSTIDACPKSFILKLLDILEDKPEEKKRPQFQVGDIVQAIDIVDGIILKDETGKVLDPSNSKSPAFWGWVAVEFMHDINCHSCDGRGKDFHCRWCPPDSIRLLYREPK